ncbi:hypothetical protein TcG_08339 [Trypanosoma cruzi]|nr:hypothetical protein TcG_08339 [Trypanosoma cruzi]
MPNFEGKLVRAAAVWTLCSLFLFCPLNFGTAVGAYSRARCMRPVNATRISRCVGNRMERGGLKGGLEAVVGTSPLTRPCMLGAAQNRVLGRGAPNAPRGYLGPRIGT